MKKTKIKSIKGFRFSLLALLIGFVFILPNSVLAADLFIDPDDKDREPGDIFPVTLMIESSDQAVNSISATFDFPSNLMEVVSVSKKGSIIDLWTTGPSFSNRYGTVDFEGVVLDPGFKGVAGEILTVNFKANKEGKAILQYFYPKVLINDGQDENVLKDAHKAEFFIKVEEEEGPIGGDPEAEAIASTTEKEESENEEEKIEEEVLGEVPGAVAIRSSSHPDPEKWYSNNTVELFWDMPDKAKEVKVLANMFSTSSPKVHYDYRLASKTLEEVADGKWYFHIQLKNDAGWGDIVHFPFKIDTISPADLEVETASGSGELMISAQDGLSGIDRYEINTDNSTSTFVWRSSGEDILKLYDLKAGEHTLYITAYDKAGNQASTSFEMFLENDLPALPEGGEDSGTVKAGEDEVEKKRAVVVNNFKGLEFKRFDLGLWQIVSIVLAALAIIFYIKILILKRKLDGCRKTAFKKMRTAEKVLNSVYSIIFDQVGYLERAKKRKKKLTTQETKVLKEMKDALEEVESEYK